MQDGTAWSNLTTGAWCYYDNNAANGTTHGKLYNWYAVNDPRGLAPKGYHIPTDEEWTKLADYLGGENKAGKKIKNTSGWRNDGNGTNSSGFSGLPFGSRDHIGAFFGIDNYGFWWSSSEYDTNTAWVRYLFSSYGGALRNASNKKNGLSVRFIKN